MLWTVPQQMLICLNSKQLSNAICISLSVYEYWIVPKSLTCTKMNYYSPKIKSEDGVKDLVWLLDRNLVGRHFQINKTGK
jgi:hypothetical protein